MPQLFQIPSFAEKLRRAKQRTNFKIQISISGDFVYGHFIETYFIGYKIVIIQQAY